MDVLGNVSATFSKSPKMWSGDPDWQPREIVRGRGARVLGSDGRWYLDWVSGLGAIALGHQDGQNCGKPANMWARRLKQHIRDGAGFSLPHVLERSVAEKLAAMLGAHIPGWQAQPLGVRWLKTGSDACMAAVRLARAVTGRRPIVSVGYHGWHDAFVSATPPAWGTVTDQHIRPVPFGEGRLLTLAASVGYIGMEGLAAIIIEQPPQLAPDGYWQAVQRLCREHGALLIVDEVVTGLRYALGGACERFGIEPDIICMAKAIGNGLPIAAIVGRREYWKWFARIDPVFVSSTSFGDAVSLAAADAVLDLWDQAAVDHIWEIGQALMDGLAEAGYQVTGYPPVFLCRFPSKAAKAYFTFRMAQEGVLWNRPTIPNLSHSMTDVEMTLDVARKIKQELQTVDVEKLMKGRLPAVLFEGR